MELTIDITSRCNHDCIYCYQEDGGIISRKEVNGYVKKYNPKKVFIGGGEPLMHPEFDGIVCDLNKKVEDIGIATNGTIVNEKLFGLEKLSMQFNIPSLQRERYEYLTGKDDFSRVIKNLKVYKKEVFSSMYFTVLQQNMEELEDMVEFSQENKLPLIVAPCYKNNKLTEKQLIKLRDKLWSYRIKRNVVESILFEKGCEALNWKKGCICKGKRIYISPSKRESLCEFL